MRALRQDLLKYADFPLFSSIVPPIIFRLLKARAMRARTHNQMLTFQFVVIKRICNQLIEIYYFSSWTKIKCQIWYTLYLHLLEVFFLCSNIKYGQNHWITCMLQQINLKAQINLYATRFKNDYSLSVCVCVCVRTLYVLCCGSGLWFAIASTIYVHKTVQYQQNWDRYVRMLLPVWFVAIFTN